MPCTERKRRYAAGPRQTGGEATGGTVHGTRREAWRGAMHRTGEAIVRQLCARNGRASSRRGVHRMERTPNGGGGSRRGRARNVPGSAPVGPCNENEEGGAWRHRTQNGGTIAHRGCAHKRRTSSRRCHAPNGEGGAPRSRAERTEKLPAGPCTERGGRCAAASYT